jgi:hypothetical protein
MHTGSGYEPSKGLYGPVAAVTTQLCCLGLQDGSVITGGAGGHVLLWQGRNCLRCVPAPTLNLVSPVLYVYAQRVQNTAYCRMQAEAVAAKPEKH